jgi:four helix bundle protein
VAEGYFTGQAHLQINQRLSRRREIRSHAEGSKAELNTQLIIAVELGYCTKADARAPFELMAEMKRMLNAPRRKLQADVE